MAANAEGGVLAALPFGGRAFPMLRGGGGLGSLLLQLAGLPLFILCSKG